MNIMNAFTALSIFVVAIITGSGFYGGLVNDYENVTAVNASSKINTTNYGHVNVLEQLNETQSEMESGLRTATAQIPIIGGTLVQVFSALQLLKAFFGSLWDAVTLGAMLITSVSEIIPFPIDNTVLNLVYMVFMFMFLSGLVNYWLNRRN